MDNLGLQDGMDPEEADHDYINKVIFKFNDNFKKLFEIYAIKFGQRPNPIVDPFRAGSSSSSSSRMTRDININLFNQIREDASKRQRSSAPTSELGNYIGLGSSFVMNLQPEQFAHFDILAYWKEKESTYPILVAMARDLLSVQASTVAYESAFSVSGRIISERRSRLTPEAVEVCVCLKDYLDGVDMIQNQVSLECHMLNDVEEVIVNEEIERGLSPPRAELVEGECELADPESIGLKTRRSADSYRKQYDGRISRRNELQGRYKEVHYFENVSNFETSRKRKFSPVVWNDRVEKQDFIADVDIRKCSLATDEFKTSSVESVVSNVSDGVEVPNFLATRTPDEEVEIEEGGYVEERKLSKSKWAFEDSPRMASRVNNSSPESGGFQREGSDGNDELSSLSTEDERLEYIDDKVAIASMDYLKSEDGDDDLEVPRCSGFGMMPSCRNVFEYEKLGKISEGTYGVVYKARDKKNGEVVALKKVKIGKESEGFPITALREINVLSLLQHPSVVEIKEVVMDDFNGVYMVMDYIDHELKGYMDRMKQPFSQSEVKSLMLQILEGLSYLHDNWVMHRDLKTSNLLLNSKGDLKICDFGMARQHGSPTKAYTPLVVTLWYRAPELLLGVKSYTTAVDMWSVGCIMAEMLSKKPLFDGNRELEQIEKIFGTLGTPNDSIWPGYSKLPGVKPKFVNQSFNTLRKRFAAATFTGAPMLTELGLDLLNKLLTYDPSKRISAKDALNHQWFCEAPLPAEHCFS
ncbi:cyclin-dependent kinase G-1-like [Rutidosis leptorrhynchoides]|uniref:cyclin-dependent kinase G-1-like n=1 Tax=Rutidosis leptorrhynchoides TaxID=125765 RepID=UPI003A9A63FF